MARLHSHLESTSVGQDLIPYVSSDQHLQD